MLKTNKKLTIILGAMAATLALTVSIPNSGSITLLSTASANNGGGDGGSDNIDNVARPGRFGSVQRRRSWVFYRPGPSAAQRAAARERNAIRRAARRARIARADARAAARRGPAAARRHADLLARKAAREARRAARARARAARRKAVADRMRARRMANAAGRNVRRMFGMDFNNDFASTTDPKTGVTTTMRTDRFGNLYVAPPNPNPNVVPVAAPVAPPAPAPNTPWASSYNPDTGITTHSMPNPAGGHTVTLTNPAGGIVNQFNVSY